jgi:predicted PurR-regulated permease PerM
VPPAERPGGHPESGVAAVTPEPSAASDQAPYVKRTKRWSLVVLVLIAFVGAAIVAAPVLIAVVLGTVLAVSAQRPFRIVCKALHGRKGLAAALVTAAAGLLVAFVGSGFLVALANELMRLVTHLNEHGSSGSLSAIIGERAAYAIERAGIDTGKLYAWLQREVEAAASFAAASAAVVLRTTSEAFLGFIVALMTMYYMLLEGPGLAHRLERVVPLEPRHTRALLVEARDVAHSAFIGTIATALVQGVIAGIGYAVLGVPQPMLWAAATALASFIPVAGTALVWGPVVVYLLVEGHPARALFMTAWGLIVVMALSDYVIRPRIVGRRGHAHPLLTLIALLGGIEVFGLAGIIIAPIVMSLFVAAFRLYEREVTAGAVPGTRPPSERVGQGRLCEGTSEAGTSLCEVGPA